MTTSTFAASATAPDRRATTGPYKFLDYFDEQDEDSFAGRERDIQECLARIAKARTFVLYARSGLGKTSLLKAGLFPPLRRRGYRPIYVRTLVSPRADLIAAIAAEAGLAPDVVPEDLRSLLDLLPSVGRVVLVIDQFEEFFIRFRDRPAERSDFLDVIAGLVRATDIDVRVVFSLREDYLAELDDFRGALPGLGENSYRLPSLTAFGAREAITRPLLRHDILYSPALVAQMIDLLDQVNFDPPLLQIFCTEVYLQAMRRASGDPELTEQDLRDVGGLTGIFRRYLNAVTASIPAGQLLLARAVLDILLTLEDTKRAVTLADLTGARFQATEAEIGGVLSVLVDHFLVRREVRDGVAWFELIHERLVPFVKEWLDLDPAFFRYRVARDLISNASRGEVWRQERNVLLNQGQVEGVIGPYRDRLRLDPVETEFVMRSALASRAGHDHVLAWARRHGIEASTAILLDGLADPDPVPRLSAASAAGAFPDPDGRILVACRRLATEDDPAIRRAAALSDTQLREKADPKAGKRGSRQVRSAAPPERPGRVLPDWVSRTMPTLGVWGRAAIDASTYQVRDLAGQVRGAAEMVRRRGLFHVLRDAYRHLTGDRLELDYLATKAEAGDPLDDPSIRPLNRFRAREIAYGRLLKANESALQLQGGFGALAGLIAGFIWNFTVGILSLAYERPILAAEGQVEDVQIFYTIVISWLASIVLMIAPLIGWRAALADGRETILHGFRYRPFRLGRSRLLLALFGVASVIVLVPAIDKHFIKIKADYYYQNSLSSGAALYTVSSFVAACYLVTSRSIPYAYRILILLAGTLAWFSTAIRVDTRGVMLLTILAFVAPLALAVVLEWGSDLIVRAASAGRDRLRMVGWGWLGTMGLAFCVPALLGLVRHAFGRPRSVEIVEVGYGLSLALAAIAAARWQGRRKSTIKPRFPAPAVPSPRLARGIILGAAGLTFLCSSISLVLAGRLELSSPKQEPPPQTDTFSTPYPTIPPPTPSEVAPAPPTPPPNFREAIDQVETSTISSYYRSDWRADRGRWNDVVAAYRKVLAEHEGPLEPADEAYARSKLAEALSRRGDLAAAIEEGSKAVELQPEDPGYRNELAWNLCLAGRYAEALPHARRSIELRPEDLNSHDTLAHAAYGASSWDEAARAWERVLEQQPGYFDDRSHLSCDRDRAHYEDARRRAPASEVAPPPAAGLE